MLSLAQLSFAQKQESSKIEEWQSKMMKLEFLISEFDVEPQIMPSKFSDCFAISKINSLYVSVCKMMRFVLLNLMWNSIPNWSSKFSDCSSCHIVYVIVFDWQVC